ncbi:MAG: hypothetical protein ACR2FS_10045 [Phormidesmis sp.]
MTMTVLPQLKEIESDLVAKEETLAAQLKELREQLNGVRAVMPMFEGKSESATEAPAPAASSQPEESTPSVVPPANETAPAATKAPKAKRKKATAKKDGRAASWQKYTRPGVKNESIPDAVRLILETQPDKDFKIVEVMEALFEEGMPKAQYLKARNRISNVLSGGVRAGDWHRGERSTYRLTTA